MNYGCQSYQVAPWVVPCCPCFVATEQSPWVDWVGLTMRWEIQLRFFKWGEFSRCKRFKMWQKPSNSIKHMQDLGEALGEMSGQKSLRSSKMHEPPQHSTWPNSRRIHLIYNPASENRCYVLRVCSLRILEISMTFSGSNVMTRYSRNTTYIVHIMEFSMYRS